MVNIARFKILNEVRSCTEIKFTLGYFCTTTWMRIKEDYVKDTEL